MLQNVQLYQLELMQRLPPRWPPPVPQTAPWGRPAFVPPPPPPPRGFPVPPRFYPQPPRPATGFYPRVPPRPLVDPEQLWLDSFRRTHCSSEEKFERATKVNGEPPLRLLRRRVVQAQKLTEQLKKEVMELAAVEKRLKSSEDAASSVEAPRLRVQRERKIAACEALKTQLEAMQATSGLFSVKQLAEIRAFAARVDKKKAYRKRAKLRRRVEMSIRRAANAKIPEKVESIDTDKTASEEESKTGRHDADAVYQEEKTVIPSLTPDSGCPEQSLDPETLTLDSLIQVRRAWDSYIVFPQTPGASTIPPHFVPPPPSPSAQWAVYARIS